MKLDGIVRKQHIVQVLAIVSVSFTSLGYGMHYAWTSPSIPKLVKDDSIKINMDDASYLIILQAVGMIITAPLFSLMIDKIGRKISVILAAVPQIIGWIMIAFGKNVYVFYAAKFIVGVGDAAVYATIPVYVCEIANPVVRNNWSNLLVIAAYSGMCIINVLAVNFNVAQSAFICLGYSCFLLVISSWIPESPYYLLMKHKVDDAQKVLKRLRMSVDVEEELNTLKDEVTKQMLELGTWKDLFCIMSHRKALAMSLGVKTIQQLSGIVAFEVYAEYMFQEADVNISPSTSAIIFTGTLLLSTTICLLSVRKYGRKPLLLFSCVGCGFCLAAEAAYFITKDITNTNVSGLYWFPLSVMIIYVIFCSFGLSTIPIIYAGELFSTSIKGKALIANNIFFAMCVLITPKIFQILTGTFGIFAPFCLFAICCFVGAVLVYLYLLETKGKTLEEIQRELKSNLTSNYCETNM